VIDSFIAIAIEANSMPIVDVRIVSEAALRDAAGLARALADTLGQTFDAAPGRVWVRLDTLPAAQYAENGETLAADGLPVFVTVLHAHLPSPAALEKQASAIARSVAGVTGRSIDRVHVEFAPAGAGRVAFGGRMVG
jgi:phenylpyruvate tautomerase PptA (4-oxalocrotonate tautomerase family)